MKIVTSIAIVLLVILLAAAGFFYISIYKPQTAELAKFKAGQPEFDKTRAELKKYRDREKMEAEQAAWTAPTADSLKKAFENEIAGGKAEVVTTGNKVVVNFTEQVLFTPASHVFAKNSQQSLATIAALLKGVKDKDIYIGNATQPAPAQGKGRKKIPSRDARTLAANRSIELAKYLEKNGVSAESLVVVSYPAKQPDRGFKIKGNKTVIIIAAPVTVTAAAEPAAPKQEPKSAPAPASKPTPTPAAAAPQGQQPKPIPISPAPRKAQ